MKERWNFLIVKEQKIEWITLFQGCWTSDLKNLRGIGLECRRTGRREGGGESGCVRKWRRWREAKERGSKMLGKEKITMYTIIVIVYTITFEKLNGGSANSKKKLESTVQMFEISRDNVNLLKQYQFVHLIVILVFQL